MVEGWRRRSGGDELPGDRGVGLPDRRPGRRRREDAGVVLAHRGFSAAAREVAALAAQGREPSIFASSLGGVLGDEALGAPDHVGVESPRLAAGSESDLGRSRRASVGDSQQRMGLGSGPRGSPATRQHILHLLHKGEEAARIGGLRQPAQLSSGHHLHGLETDLLGVLDRGDPLLDVAERACAWLVLGGLRRFFAGVAPGFRRLGLDLGRSRFPCLRR